MTFNVLAPNTVGLEWFPVTRDTVTLDSAAKALGFVIRSSGVETIDTLVMPFEMTGPPSGFGKLWVDVYDLADMNEGAVTEAKYIANQTIDTSSGYIKRDWAHPDLHTALDHYDDNFDPTNEYIINTDHTTVRTARLAYNTAAFPAAARPLYVKFELRVRAPFWAPQSPRIGVHWYNGTTDHGELGRVLSPKDDKDRTYVLGPFYVNPQTQEPWTQADIVALDSGTTAMIGFEMEYATALSRATIVVGYVTDKRVAVGGTTATTVPPVGIQTNTPFTLKTKAGVDNWAKAGGKNYLAVVRRLDHPLPLLGASPFTATFTSINSGMANPQDQGHVYTVALESPGGQVTTSELTTAAVGYWLATTGGAQTVDEQPYWRLLPGAVDSGSTLTQRVSGVSTQTYDAIRALIGTYNVRPLDALSIKIRRVSDNAQIGGTATLTAADLDDVGKAVLKGTVGDVTWYDVTVLLSSGAALVAGTQYYVEFTSTAFADYQQWQIGVLDATATHAYTGNRTFGAGTDYVVIDGVAFTLADAAVTISAGGVPGDEGGKPDPPAPIGVDVRSAAMPSNGSSRCSVATLGYVQVSWSATAIGDLFLRYDLDRSDDGGTTWDRIAEITTEATIAFNDYEGPHNDTATKYRIRAVSTASPSDWVTQADTVTLPIPSGLAFVSNANPVINCAYVEASPSKVYEFLSSSEEVEMRMHMRDYQTVFKPLEERGVRWSVPIIVWGANEPDIPADPTDGAGTPAFDRLRAVTRQGAPYVAVFTPDGQRFFASVRAGSGTRREPAALYISEVTITQVAGSPSIVED